MDAEQMSHSICGECSKLEYRAAGGLHIGVGRDIIGHNAGARPVSLSSDTMEEAVLLEPSLLPFCYLTQNLRECSVFCNQNEKLKPVHSSLPRQKPNTVRSRGIEARSLRWEGTMIS